MYADLHCSMNGLQRKS